VIVQGILHQGETFRGNHRSHPLQAFLRVKYPIGQTFAEVHHRVIEPEYLRRQGVVFVRHNFDLS
jgi:hypothetical protein